MKKKILLFTLFALYACSANKDVVVIQEKANNINTHFLKISDTLQIFLPDSIPHISSEIRPFFSSDAHSFSYLVSAKGNSLAIYRYFFKGEWKKVSLKIDGPNQVYSEGAFEFHEKDLFYFPLVTPEIIILNEGGVVEKRFSYSKNRDNAYNSQVKNPRFFTKNSNIFFDLAEYRDLNDLSTYSDSRLLGIFDYTSDKLRKEIKFPQEFKDKRWSGNDVNRNFVVVDDYIYVNFVKSPFIYKYDLNGQLVNQKSISTQEVKNSVGLSKISDGYQDALVQLVNGYYDNLIYDKFRKVFYRFAIYIDTQENITSIEDLGKQIHKRTLAIIIFDEDMNMLGISEFNNFTSKISEKYYFINEDGLFLFSNLPTNKDNGYSFFKLELTNK